MINYIIAVGAGIIIGQEVEEIPRLKPYVLVAYNKTIDILKDFHKKITTEEKKDTSEGEKKK